MSRLHLVISACFVVWAVAGCSTDFDGVELAEQRASLDSNDLAVPAVACGDKHFDAYEQECLAARGVPACSSAGPVCCSGAWNEKEGQICGEPEQIRKLGGLALGRVTAESPVIGKLLERDGLDTQLDDAEMKLLVEEVERLRSEAGLRIDELDLATSPPDGSTARFDVHQCLSGCDAISRICEIFSPSQPPCPNVQIVCIYMCENALLMSHGIPPIPIF
jgi:hypothetical protein